MSVELKTHPPEVTMAAKWDSTLCLGQSPEGHRGGALQLALPRARPEGSACCRFSGARLPAVSTWAAASFVLTQTLGRIPIAPPFYREMEKERGK